MQKNTRISSKHVPRDRIKQDVSPDKQDNAGSSAGRAIPRLKYPFDGAEIAPFHFKPSRAGRKLSIEGTGSHIRRLYLEGDRD
jgi:hypothetical protein